MSTVGVRSPEEGNGISAEPYYEPAGREIEIFEQCHQQGLPVMLKGPTGCGKTRFVSRMAWQLGRPLVTVACHDDLTASDLTGRYLVRGADTVWQDGPLTHAVRTGAICYLDEFVEARQDTLVLIHPLTDDRRVLPLEKTGEHLHAQAGFQLVVSYNPASPYVFKDLKASTRQRFVTLEFQRASFQLEAQIIAHESGVSHEVALSLAELAQQIRRLELRGITELPGTRLLVAAGKLIAKGISAIEAVEHALILALTDDQEVIAAMRRLTRASLSG